MSDTKVKIIKKTRVVKISRVGTQGTPGTGTGGGAGLSDATPAALGAAAAGDGTLASRDDHVHAMPTAGQVGADPAGTATTAANAAQAAAAIDATAKANAAAAASVPTTALGVSVAQLVGGVVPTAQIPAVAITEYLGAVANQAAMLALVGQKGDWAIRTDTGFAWIITGNDPTQLADWTALSYPGAPVVSVNGQTGVITLGPADVGADPAGAAAAAQAAAIAAAASDATAKANAAQAAAQTASEPALSLGVNTFRARSSSGAAANKAISDAALALLDDADFAAMRTTLGIVNGVAVNVQAFTASGTWTKPAGVTSVHAIVIAPGGGAGSGRRGAAGTIRCGGGGGAGGGRSEKTMPAASLPSTVAVTVGAPGVGGAARTTNDTSGANGTTGGNSSFGNVLFATGGPFGSGGTATSGTGGSASTGLLSGGGSGSPASVTGGAGGAGGVTLYASTGGSAGGGITAADVRSPGGQSRDGSGITFSGHTGVTLPPGNFVNADAGAATNGSSDAATLLGTGGGGSPSSLLTNASPGGNGGGYGAGGGGGGASVNSVGNSGAGGNGADGYVVVISW